MRVKVGRLACAAACLIWLAGCETTSTPDNPFQKLGNAFRTGGSSDSDVTGSVDKPLGEASVDPLGNPGLPPPLTPELLGSDPNDDLSIAKKYYHQGSYGLAERHFRKAVELHPRDAESWVGLAAAYDRLRRFDLADRAYEQAIKLVGLTPEIMNNQGFSYMLRSDYRRARSTLVAARAKDPESRHIAANLRMLDQAERKAKGVN
jgi:tetratricopeptide (TPR) repeat protein